MYNVVHIYKYCLAINENFDEFCNKTMYMWQHDPDTMLKIKAEIQTNHSQSLIQDMTHIKSTSLVVILISTINL